MYVTTDYVLTELITQLYRSTSSESAEPFIAAVFSAIESRQYQLELVSTRRFEAAWELRRRYSDKPGISFVDFTSCVVMRELGIQHIFTGDGHFTELNMGFQLFLETHR